MDAGAENGTGVSTGASQPPRKAEEQVRLDRIRGLSAAFPAMVAVRRIAEWEWSFLPAMLKRYRYIFNPKNEMELWSLDCNMLRDLFIHEGIDPIRTDEVFALFSNDVPGHEVVDIFETFAGLCLLMGGDFVR